MMLKDRINIIKAYFSKGHERSIKVKKNIILSFTLKGFSIIIQLFFVPLCLGYLDKERYGIWLTVSSLVTWFTFFDIGLSNGMRNKLTESIAKGDKTLSKQYVSTTYALMLLIFIPILIIFFIINPFLNWASILNTSIASSNELGLLFAYVFTFFILRFIFMLIGTVAYANQMSALNNFISPTGNLIALIIIFILTRVSHGNLLYLGIAISASPIVVLLVSSIILYNGRFKSLKPSVKYVNFSLSKNLMSLGLNFFLISITSTIIFSTANIIISQLFSPSEVTPYNIAYRYFQVPVMLYGIILSPYWSAVTDAYAKHDLSWLKNTLNKLNKLSIYLIILIVIMLFFSSLIYKIWVGKTLTIDITISISMALWAIITVSFSPYSQIINGVGKLKLSLIFAIINSVGYPFLAIFLAKSALGVAGIMYATSILILINSIFQIVQVNKIFNNRAYGIWNK
jgi:O-antigen/teichoic acid export membrane protein